MTQLVQPIYVTTPEPSHKIENVLTLEQFIKLLKEEEDYWEGEQHNTKLIITRLRKIFYDQWGWNKELIRGAASIKGRYVVTVVDEPQEYAKPIRYYKKNEYVPKHRAITYSNNDRIYGATRVGQTPEIYKNDHQEVVLPSGYYCDVAHILATVDAHNYPQVVSPLPGFLSFLNFLVPHVKANVDIVSWLGDIASSSGDFMFAYLRNNKKPIGTVEEQKYINIDAPGSDMVGDIDPFVIVKSYDVATSKGMRFTEILEDYYLNESSKLSGRKNRIGIYCQAIGLFGWDGRNFRNEKSWLTNYRKQLRDNVTFQVFSLTDEKLKSLWLPLLIWFNGYKDVLKLELLLEIYLKALKEELIKEPLK